MNKTEITACEILQRYSKESRVNSWEGVTKFPMHVSCAREGQDGVKLRPLM